MSLAENVKRFRNECGMSQVALAKASGVQQQLISQIEQGKNTSTKFLPQLARALKKTPQDLDPAYTPDDQSDELVTEEEILAALNRIKGLREQDRTMLLQIITVAQKANASIPGQTDTGDRSAPETHPHESQPSQPRSGGRPARRLRPGQTTLPPAREDQR